MFSNLKLKGRLLAGYSIPVVICVGIVGLVYSTASKVFDTFQEVERVQTVLIDVNDMSADAKSMIQNLRGHIIDSSQGFNKDYQEDYQKTKQVANHVEGLIKIPEQKILIQKMIEAVENYNEYGNQAINLVNQGKQAEAVKLFKAGTGTRFAQEFDELQTKFKEREEAVLKQETQASKAALSQMLTVLILGSILLILLATATALFISSGITHTINQAVNAIASSSTEIAATIEQQEHTAAHQASAVNQTTTTMDELGSSSRISAEQAEVAAASAQQVLTLAETGNAAVNYTLEDMAVLKDKVEAIANQILELSEQTNQIGSISTLVKDLANQTNMLALNAAIEAVRAGEHGKGFAVVAGEIRKLAEQSKHSTDRINTLVSTIQNAIQVTVNVTNEGTKKVEQGVKTAEGTALTFARVADAVKSVVTSSQQISLTAKQQAIAIQQVVDSMNSINQGAIENASGINQTKIGTQKLNEAALNLQAVV
ncbi:MAG TPA: methyl-accepting chemotaxis protein [Oculatellaceae cyanobacterium]|jgi:methyl-accepting chemotaxis protein